MLLDALTKLESCNLRDLTRSLRHDGLCRIYESLPASKWVNIFNLDGEVQSGLYNEVRLYNLKSKSFKHGEFLQYRLSATFLKNNLDEVLSECIIKALEACSCISKFNLNIKHTVNNDDYEMLGHEFHNRNFRTVLTSPDRQHLINSWTYDLGMKVYTSGKLQFGTMYLLTPTAIKAYSINGPQINRDNDRFWANYHMGANVDALQVTKLKFNE